jgi:hypothetical protein
MTDMETRYKNLLSTEIAGVKASYKDTGAKPEETAALEEKEQEETSHHYRRWRRETNGSTAAAACSGENTSQGSAATRGMRPGRNSRPWTNL